MSMDYGTSHGYGISTSEYNDKVTLESIQKLLNYAPKLKTEIEDEILADIENPTVEDYACYENEYGYNGFAPILASVINEATGLHLFDTTQDYETDEEFIIMYSGMPWEFSDKVKSLHADDIDAIIKKYAKILFNEDVVPDYLSPHWYG